jgi:hypothetical protein
LSKSEEYEPFFPAELRSIKDGTLQLTELIQNKRYGNKIDSAFSEKGMTVLNIVLIRIEIIGSVDEEPRSVAATIMTISLSYGNIDNA